MPRIQQILIKCLGIKTKRMTAVLSGCYKIIKGALLGLRLCEGDLESARRMGTTILDAERGRDPVSRGLSFNC